MLRKLSFAALAALAPELLFGQSWLDALAPWRDPDEQSLVVSGSFGDSDEDAVYAAQRSWRKRLPDSDWLLGWDLGLGAADSGKYDRVGALASADLVFKRPLWESDRFSLGFNAVFGGQVHSIRFPGESYHNGRLGGFFDLAFQPRGGRSLELRFGYLHISNANLSGGNEGHDALWAGAGLRW